MNERQCVPAPESLLIGCMQTYLWRDERSGRCYFRLETRQEMPMKEMIRDSYVKNNLDNKEIRWNVINCDATQAGISFFKERTPIKVYGYFSLDSMPDGVAYDFIVTRVEETDAEEMTILEYLITFPGINFSDAVVIVKNHGTDMFRMVHQPGIVNRLVAETRLPSNVISNLCKSIASTTEERKVFELLHDCGVSYAACAKAVKLYGSSVEEKIMEDPYSYGKKLGLGFLTCDKLGVKFHKPAEFFGRIKLAAFEAANILSANGHTYYTGELFHYNIQRILNSGCYAEHVPTSAVLTAIGKDYLQEVDGQNCIIHPQKYLTAEKRIAKNIRRLASASCENQSFSPDLILYAARACKMNYGEQQRSAFPMVLRKKGVKILTGGPGTGKTTTILGILLAYKRMHPKDTIRLCAPTGRAAQRMAESTHMEAVTVHRLLDLKPYGDTTVCKDSSDPIDADLIVVDEMSMINIEVFDLLLEAIKTGTTLVLVGDINQLESVGAGAVLHDLLEAPESLIPRTMLTDVFRQKGDSSIISNAKEDDTKTSADTTTSSSEENVKYNNRLSDVTADWGENEFLKEHLSASDLIELSNGISLFASRSGKVSAGMDGLNSVATAKKGSIVTKNTPIDGNYYFTPIIGSKTKITFGTTDSNYTWDNEFCKNAQYYSKAISNWWAPQADTTNWSNTRSFIPHDGAQGHLYAEYTNVGYYDGSPVNMKIWFLDWQNTVVPDEYKAPHKPAIGDDIDAVIVSLGPNNSNDLSKGYTPLIDIKGLKWIKVKFAYYKQNGDPISLKGHFTMSDLDFAQGFHIQEKVENIYLTQEADDRLVYDPRTDAIWSARSGGESDGGTTPDNSNGWVTYTFEGDSQTVIFYNGGTISNVTGPGGGLKEEGIQKYPDSFYHGEGSKFNGWEGSSNTTSASQNTWYTSEFGYTSEYVGSMSKVGVLRINKTDSDSGAVLKGAKFTVYKWKNSKWQTYANMNWVEADKCYLLNNIQGDEADGNKFKVVETRNPDGYTGTFSQEFTVDQAGVKTIVLDAKNTQDTFKVRSIQIRSEIHFVKKGELT